MKKNKNIVIVPSQFIYYEKYDSFQSGFLIFDITTTKNLDQVISKMDYDSERQEWYIQLLSIKNGWLQKYFKIVDRGYSYDYEVPTEYIHNVTDMEHTILTTYRSSIILNEERWNNYIEKYNSNNISPNTAYDFFIKFLTN